MSKRKVFSYFDTANYEYMIETKANLIHDGYNNSSSSKIIQLAMNELRKNNEYQDVKEKLLEMDMIQ